MAAISRIRPTRRNQEPDRFGYDGKGQAIIRDGDDPERILGGPRPPSPPFLESLSVPFEREVSMIAAAQRRTAMSNASTSPKTNIATHILKIFAPRRLRSSDAPGGTGAQLLRKAIANALNYVGRWLAVEMFVLAGPGRAEHYW